MREFLFAISAIDMLIHSLREVRSSTCGILSERGVAFGAGARPISCGRGGATLTSCFGSKIGVGVGAASECAECVECKNLCLSSLPFSSSMTSWSKLSISRAAVFVQSMFKRR